MRVETSFGRLRRVKAGYDDHWWMSLAGRVGFFQGDRLQVMKVESSSSAHYWVLVFGGNRSQIEFSGATIEECIADFEDRLAFVRQTPPTVIETSMGKFARTSPDSNQWVRSKGNFKVTLYRFSDVRHMRCGWSVEFPGVSYCYPDLEGGVYFEEFPDPDPWHKPIETIVSIMKTQADMMEGVIRNVRSVLGEPRKRKKRKPSTWWARLESKPVV